MFGPLSLFGLIAVWAAGLIFGFALLHWSLTTATSLPDTACPYTYFSGTTFFTLGYGDIVPIGRIWAMHECHRSGARLRLSCTRD